MVDDDAVEALEDEVLDATVAAAEEARFLTNSNDSPMAATLAMAARL